MHIGPQQTFSYTSKQASKKGVYTNQSPQVASQQEMTPSKGTFNLVASKRPPPMQVGYNEEGIPQKRHVLYRNFHQIPDDRDPNGHVYLVEISRSDRKVNILLFPNFETPEVFKSCIMTEKQATRLMGECNNVFDDFIKRFFIKFQKLQIEGFHTKPQLVMGGVSGPVRPSRQYFSVSPTKKRQYNIFASQNQRNNGNVVSTGLFNVHPNALIKHGYNATGAPLAGEHYMIAGGGAVESADQSRRVSKQSSVPRSGPTTRQMAQGFFDQEGL